jgi:hypothetical protein
MRRVEADPEAPDEDMAHMSRLFKAGAVFGYFVLQSCAWWVAEWRNWDGLTDGIKPVLFRTGW